MSLIHKKGFFPFPIVDESTIPLTGRASTTVPVVFPLAELTKLFWLLKSFDWDINLTYALAEIGGAMSYENGTVIGSGTSHLLETYQTNSRGTGAIPAERVLISDLFEGLLPEINDSLSCTQSVVFGDNSSGPFSSSGSLDPGFLIFAGVVSTMLPLGMAYVTKSGADYLTRIAFSIFSIGSNLRREIDIDVKNLGETCIDSGCKLTFKCTGCSDILMPIYFNSGLSLTGISLALTGGVTINCNNFWPP